MSSLHPRLQPAYVPKRLPICICHSFSISCSPFNGTVEGFTAIIDSPPFLWICLVYLDRSQALGSPKKSHLYCCGQWCWVAGCVCTSYSSHTVTITQQSTYHNMTVVLINRVALDSSYCVIGVFRLGSVMFMWKKFAFLEHWTLWKSEVFWAVRSKWDIWCGIFKFLIYI